ncbi:hypothetical protein [Acidithiobacillus ferriphilus]|uniref:hypothetical protein n=1 Tax=Acidithiobacillus ferriphilus TaxID=1689834 RepID=UPI001C073D72|nr:hypothetical protein [Acidithiobacillus ferriphilus]MBU2831889.1 hypothetical protein [Acidithiobacillus ferriphilus]
MGLTTNTVIENVESDAYAYDAYAIERYGRDLEIEAADLVVADCDLFGAARTQAYFAAKKLLKEEATRMRKLQVIVTRALKKAASTRMPKAKGSTVRGSATSGQTARAQHTSTGGSNDADPDPLDVIIQDPYSRINSDPKSRPINRIARKAILAHRQGIEQKNPPAYNWYVARTLREIERAMLSVLRKTKTAISRDSLEEIPLAAVRLFSDLATDNKHDFGRTPNLVFTKTVADRCFKTTFRLHDYVTTDKRNPGAAAARKEAADLGIAEGSSREVSGCVYDAANGLVPVEDGGTPRIYTLSEKNAIAPVDFEIDGVKIKHLPAAPVQIRPAQRAAQMVALSRDDDDASDALELDAVTALGLDADAALELDADAADAVAAVDPTAHDQTAVTTRRDYAVINAHDLQNGRILDTRDADELDPDAETDVQIEVYTDSPEVERGGIDDTAASRKAKLAAENALHVKAGTIARQLVLYVRRARDKEVAVREVAAVLHQQEGGLGNLVLSCIRKDRESPEVFAALFEAIPKAANRAAADAHFSLPTQPTLDPALVRIGRRMSDITIVDCRKQHIEMLYQTIGGFSNRGNLRSLLRTRALNKQGLFPPEVVRVARLLMDEGDAA